MLKNTYIFYPDANSTMRLTYGKIANYTPIGGLRQLFTTLDDMIARENPNDPDFIIDPHLKNCIIKKILVFMQWMVSCLYVLLVI